MAVDYNIAGPFEQEVKTEARMLYYVEQPKQSEFS